MSSQCIEVADLVKQYGDLTAVQKISFSVNKGEILGILGPNGSGKTTILKSVLGLIEFNEGRVQVNGLNIQKRRHRILEDMGAVLEGARNTYWFLSPRENLEYFAGIRGLSRKASKTRVNALLDSLDLRNVADKPVREFSTGMKQKCSLACAFVHDPEILLLDEPTLGLDVEISRFVQSWLRRIVAEEGKTILITSHDMNFIESICDRILILRQGRIVSHETVSSLKKKFAGTYFHIELDRSPSSNLIEILSSLGRVTLEGASLKVELSSLSNLLPMVQAIECFDGNLVSFRTIENDLEDIFLEMIREGSDEDA